MRYNGGTNDVPLVDNVVDLKFEYFGDQSADAAQAARGGSQLPVRRRRQLRRTCRHSRQTTVRWRSCRGPS